MNTTYTARKTLGINSWPWIVGFTVLLVTLFFPPPLPLPFLENASSPFQEILRAGGSFWQALYTLHIPAHSWGYELRVNFWSIISNFLTFCGFPLLWSMISVGMWARIVNHAKRPALGNALLALFLADVVAFLLSIVLIWLVAVVYLSRLSPGHDPWAYVTFIVVGVIVAIQAFLYLPFVLLVGAIIAKFQARSWPSAL